MRIALPCLTASLLLSTAIIAPSVLQAGPDDPVLLPSLFSSNLTIAATDPYQRYEFAENTATIDAGVNVSFDQGTLVYLQAGFVLTNNGTLFLNGFPAGNANAGQLILNPDPLAADPALVLQSTSGSFGVVRLSGGAIAQSSPYDSGGTFGYARLVNAANHTISGFGQIGTDLRLNNFGRIIADHPGETLSLGTLRDSTAPVANASTGALLALNGGTLAITASEDFLNHGLIAAVGSSGTAPVSLKLRDGTDVSLFLNGPLNSPANLSGAVSTVTFDGISFEWVNTRVELGSAGAIYAVNGGVVKFGLVRLSPDAAGDFLRNDGTGTFVFGTATGEATQIYGGRLATAGLVFDGTTKLNNVTLKPLDVANFGEVVAGASPLPPRIRARGSLLIFGDVDVDEARFEGFDADSPYSFGLANDWTVSHEATILSGDGLTASLDTKFAGRVVFHGGESGTQTLTFNALKSGTFSSALDPTFRFDNVTFENVILKGSPLTSPVVVISNGLTDLATHNYLIESQIGGFIHLTGPSFARGNVPHPIRPQISWDGGTLVLRDRAILDGSLDGSLTTLVNPSASSFIYLGQGTDLAEAVTLQNLTLDTSVGCVSVNGVLRLGPGFQLDGTLDHAAGASTVLASGAFGPLTFAGESGYNVYLSQDLTLTSPLNLLDSPVLGSLPTSDSVATLSNVSGGVLNFNGTLTDINLLNADIQTDTLTIQNGTLESSWSNVTLGSLTFGGSPTIFLSTDLVVEGESALRLYNDTTFTRPLDGLNPEANLIVQGIVTADGLLTFDQASPFTSDSNPFAFIIRANEAVFSGGAVPFGVTWDSPGYETTLTLRPGNLIPGEDGMPDTYEARTYSNLPGQGLVNLTFLQDGYLRALDPCGCPAILGTVIINTPGNIVAGLGSEGGFLEIEGLVLQGGGEVNADHITLSGGTLFGATYDSGGTLLTLGKDIRPNEFGSLTLKTGTYGLHTGVDAGRILLEPDSTLNLSYGGTLLPGNQIGFANQTLEVESRGWFVNFSGGGIENLTLDLGKTANRVTNQNQAYFKDAVIVGDDESIFRQGDYGTLDFKGHNYLGGRSNLEVAGGIPQINQTIIGPSLQTLTLEPQTTGGSYSLVIHDTVEVTGNLILHGHVNVTAFYNEVGSTTPGNFIIPAGSTVTTPVGPDVSSSLSFSGITLSGGGHVDATYLTLEGQTTYGDITYFDSDSGVDILVSPGVTFSASEGMSFYSGSFPINYKVGGLDTRLPVDGYVYVGNGATLRDGSISNGPSYNLGLSGGTLQNVTLSGTVYSESYSTNTIRDSILTNATLYTGEGRTVLDGVTADNLAITYQEPEPILSFVDGPIVNNIQPKGSYGDLTLGACGFTASGPVTLTDIGTIAVGPEVSTATLTVEETTFATNGDLSLLGVSLHLQPGSTFSVNGGDGTLTFGPKPLVIIIGDGPKFDGVAEVATSTLFGDGTINGNVVLETGTLSPGSSTGLTILGDLAVGSEASLLLEAGPAFDSILIDGAFTLDGNGTLSFLPGFSATLGQTVTFLTYASSNGYDPDGFTVENLPEGYSFGWLQTPSSLGIEITSVPPVPEPSTYAALAGLAVLGLAWKRRRRS